MKIKKFFEIDLQLFAEGTAADTGSGATPETQANTSLPVENEETEKVVSYADLEKEYNELIKGKFKDVHKNTVQNIVKDRLKNSKNDEKLFKKLADIVGNRYGLKQEDLSLSDYARKVYDSVVADDDQFERLAVEMGVSTEQARKSFLNDVKLQEANDKIAEYERERQLNARFAKWREDEMRLQQKYPNFNLSEELKNPAFASLMDNPYITMEGAYNAVHAEERILAAVKAATDTAERNISNKIAAGKNRPTENGASSNATATTKIDVRNMTDEQRKDILRRVARGEKITF